MTDDAILPESRRSPRRRAMQPAMLRLSSGEELSCMVRDLNVTGARLKLDRQQFLTATFELTLDGEAPAACRLVWQEGEQAGVMFG